MSEVNYDTLLTESVDNIPKEVLFPTGLYVVQARSARYMPPKDGAQKPRLFINFQVKAPQDDVDMAEWNALSEADRDSTEILVVYNLVNAYDYSRVYELAEKLGLNRKDYKTKGELFDAFAKRQCIGYIKPRTYTDNNTKETRTVNDLGTFASLE